MQENVIWMVSPHRQLPDYDDRTIRISDNSKFKEALAWGLRSDFGSISSADKAFALLRSSDGPDTILTSTTDLPFIVEFWDTEHDETFGLYWNGTVWEVIELNKIDEDLYIELSTVDVNLSISKACASISLGHIEAQDTNKGTNFIALSNREFLLNRVLEQGHYFYRSVDDSTSQYTCDVAELPRVEELDLLHYVDGENASNGFIFFLWDDDLPIEIVLSKMFVKNKLAIKMLESSSTDIVDIKNLVKDHIAETDDMINHIYIVGSGEEERRYNFFFNMAAYEPTFAPFLTQPN